MQINKFQLLFFLILVIFANSCIEEYTVTLEKYEDNLVVDGLISNLPGPYKVKLTTTSKINSRGENPVTGANVVIKDNSGNSVTLSELGDGIYSTGNSNFRGVVGRRYKVEINYKNKSYSSELVKLKEPVGIKQLTAEEFYGELDIFPYELFGYQFFVEPEDLQKDSTFLYWRMTETYKFFSDFPIDFVYRHDSIIPIPYPENLDYYTCWKHNYIEKTAISKFILHNNQNSMGKIALHKIDNRTDKFSVRYSTLVTQYTIDERAYLFLKKLEEQQSDEGSLYTTQPYQIVGNVHNNDDVNDVVLGNFIVAGAAEKRIYVNRPLVSFHYKTCVPDYEGYYHLDELPNPVYIYKDNFGKVTGDASCFDCRLKGGKIEKPDFWED